MMGQKILLAQMCSLLLVSPGCTADNEFNDENDKAHPANGEVAPG